jgi:hypothetical protein
MDCDARCRPAGPELPTQAVKRAKPPLQTLGAPKTCSNKASRAKD